MSAVSLSQVMLVLVLRYHKQFGVESSLSLVVEMVLIIRLSEKIKLVTVTTGQFEQVLVVDWLILAVTCHPFFKISFQIALAKNSLSKIA